MKVFLGSRWCHPLLLLLWTAIGTGLRFTHLAAKPPWTDEFSTIVFSLGHSFRTVPLNLAIPIDVLLQPLQPKPNAGIADVVQYLLTESNHPPLYFVLAHWWMQLWPPGVQGLASVWAARALPALLGAASIPAIYGLCWLAFRSRLVGQIAAALLAVSPYGIFLAQEARQYTLAILWVIASLYCLVIATRHISLRTPLPNWLIVIWFGINFLGISTHYFFAVTLCAEALWLIILHWHHPPTSPWQQIYIVAIGTALGCLVWLPIFWQETSRGKLTDWIHYTSPGLLAWISPVFQALATWLTMISLLPVEAASIPVVIASGLIMLGFFLWVLPILSRSLRIQLQHPTTTLMTRMFAVVIVGAIAIFFIFTYAFGIDLTRGARYDFVYFPAVSVLLGVSLSVCWNAHSNNTLNLGKQSSTPVSGRDRQKRLLAGRRAVVLIWVMGLVSGLTVVCNLGYHKYYRPEILVPLIQQVSQPPVLIATIYKTHVQTGEMMGLAREFKLSSAATPLFLLTNPSHSADAATTILQQTLSQLPKPLDLWLVNFPLPKSDDGKVKGCLLDHRSFPVAFGYDYHHYHCSLGSKQG
ncbi:MAG: hypothetical protein JOZ78_26025 [Chroococcidiopsidaceae cyanobacterium CP_BM_ER_R8_30]|nr:hypothetical protein [Chroococcidiopsidaceae cyanobacterium CP_BM_ER_R8_30]